MANTPLNAGYRRLNQYLESEGITNWLGMSKMQKVHKYCELNGISEKPISKKADKFILSQYKTNGSKICSSIKLADSQRKVGVKKSKTERREKALSRKKEYTKYINSFKWKKFRQSIIDERGHRCEDCGNTSGVIHAHHLTYERFMNELPSDIRLLCIPCHEIVHGRKIGKNSTKKDRANKVIAIESPLQKLDRMYLKRKLKQDKRLKSGRYNDSQFNSLRKGLESWYYNKRLLLK